MLEISVGPDLLRHLLLMIRIKEAPILFVCFIFTRERGFHIKPFQLFQEILPLRANQHPQAIQLSCLVTNQINRRHLELELLHHNIKYIKPIKVSLYKQLVHCHTHVCVPGIKNPSTPSL